MARKALRAVTTKESPLTEREQVAKLADELFAAVELHQGFFHISDGENFDTLGEFWERIRGRLAHGRKACRIMADFLAKHGQQ